MDMLQGLRVVSVLYNRLFYFLCVVWVVLLMQLLKVGDWAWQPTHDWKKTASAVETCVRLITVDNDISQQPLGTIASVYSNSTTSRENVFKTTLEELDLIWNQNSPGDMGAGVHLDMAVMSGDQIQRLDDGYAKHGFNEYVSDVIPIRRRTPDFRHSVCRGLSYPSDLPPTSVIICFHNEAPSTLFRTVVSVLDKTPPHLLQEIILVDDFSDDEGLGRPLEDFISRLPSVRLLRAPSRLGLIGARLLGVDAATGPILTFLDSHVECLTDWLQPMLVRILHDDHNVPYPILHIIDHQDFSIREVPVGKRGLFNWMDLSYFPYLAPDDVIKRRTSAADPIPSPTMPGGIFSISRRYFDLLGRYDPGLKIWGSENAELSFKIWMCDGSIDVVPCSGIAHVFRKFNPNLGDDFYRVITTNAMRVASVWMDEYQYFLFNNFIENDTMPSFGDVTARQALRQRLQCRDFRWYMSHVATDLYAPTNATHIYEIRNGKFKNVCLAHSFTEPELLVDDCRAFVRHQKVWYLDDTGQLLGGVLNGNQTWSCLTVTPGGGVSAGPCVAGVDAQRWQYTKDNSLQNVWLQKCIALTTGSSVEMEACHPVSALTKWELKTLKHHL